MISKEATGVEFNSSSHKTTFCFIVNTLLTLPKGVSKYNHDSIIITNRDFPKVVFKQKTVILDSYIKEDISSG